jgi:positive regulator of sigma E activity
MSSLDVLYLIAVAVAMGILGFWTAKHNDRQRRREQQWHEEDMNAMQQFAESLKPRRKG